MMKLTFQELNLLCALAERLGWDAGTVKWRHAYDTLPPTYCLVDDLTRGIDVGFGFLRTRPLTSYEKGATHPIWQLVFEPWNPLESLDDAWVLVEAIVPQNDPPANQALSPLAKFAIAFPSVVWQRSRKEVARMICLAAANAWGIQTELTP